MHFDEWLEKDESFFLAGIVSAVFFLKHFLTSNCCLSNYNSLQATLRFFGFKFMFSWFADKPTTNTVQQQKKKEIYVAQGFFADLGYILATKCKSVFSYSLSRQVFEIQ